MNWPTGGKGLPEEATRTLCTYQKSSREHVHNPIDDLAPETCALSSTRCVVSVCRIDGTGPERIEAQKVSTGPDELRFGH